ncbi:MAG: ankyrin repeat domain-containing protein [Akkermansia sp.]|nr:ankyrin repeat domain-containing protein [Akkermansia sp.]
MPEYHTETSPSTNGPDTVFSFFLPSKLQLGKYKIENVMGQGGFGITYLATNTETNEQVVIKENFSTEFSYRHTQNLSVAPISSDMQETYEKVLRRFMEEAQLLARLSHPNIVPVTAAFKALGTAYYVMPHINGKDLKKSAPAPAIITAKWLVPVLKKILGALKYLHGEALIHRDIKPENILLQPNGEPMLIDFGTARAQQGTHTMTRISTPGYTPFEQISPRGNVGPWTDFYALGATCYRLITGECPVESMTRMLKDTYVPLVKRPELQKRFPAHVLKSIDKALALHPNQRWQRADEWLNTLATDLVPLTLPPADEQPMLPPPAGTSQNQKKAQKNGGLKKSGMLLTGLCILGGLSAGGYYMYTAQEPISPTMEPEKALTAAEENSVNPPTSQPEEQPVAKTDSTELTQETAAAKLREQGILPANYSSALCSAAQNGKLELLQCLIAAGADVNTNIQNSNTPLHLAVLQGHHECIRALLAAENIQPDIANCEPKTPLMIACCSGDAVSAELLLATGKVNPNVADHQGNYLLPMTAGYGHTECVQLLVNTPGINVNICAANGETALYRALALKFNEIAKILLSAPGVDVNLSDTVHGNTPLIIATATGNIECLRALLALPETDVNKANNIGLSPLIAVCSTGCTEALNLLLERQDINVNCQMKNGLSALMMAVGTGNTECIRTLINRPDINVNETTGPGVSPIVVAISSGRPESLRVLLEAPGINVNAKLKNDATVLHVVAASGQIDALKVLLEHPDIDVNAVAEHNQTPLHTAIANGRANCVQALLEHPNINLNARLSNGLTPLRLAEQSNQNECARLVREAGGK